MKKLFFMILLFLTPSWGLYALDIFLLEKLDEADKSFFNKDYDNAVKGYQDFLKETELIEKPSEEELKIISSVKTVYKDASYLLKNAPAFENIKKALKESDLETSRNLLMEARTYLTTNQIENVILYEKWLDSSLDSFLIEKRKLSLGKVSPLLLEQIKKDKARKKTIAFLGFEKDKTVSLDVGQIVTLSLTGAIERNNSFIVSTLNPKGDLNQKIEIMKSNNIDFVVHGSYIKSSQNSVFLYFSILDPVTGNSVAEISIKAPLNPKFFDAVDQIAFDLEKKLKGYSRLESFEIIKYTMEGNQKIKQEKIEVQEKETPIFPYLEENIFEIEKKYLASLKNESSLKVYEEYFQEINRFNHDISFPKKLFLEDYQKEVENEIQSLLLKQTDIGKRINRLNQFKQDEKYFDYYQFFDKAIDSIEEAQQDFPSLKDPFIAQIEANLKKEKAEMDEYIQKNGILLKPNYKIFLGFTGSGESTYDHADAAEKAGTFGGLSLLVEKNIFKNHLYFDFKINVVGGQKVDLAYQNIKYADLQTSYLSLALGLTLSFTPFDFLDCGVNAAGGASGGKIKAVSTFGGNESATIGAGYFVQGGPFLEFDFPYIPVLRFEIAYTYAKIDRYLLKGGQVYAYFRLAGF
ncbi:MAG: hypothetical protein A2Y41_11205 [Spirochaetes bacterium GWB1_36_13]|nr:MAG: hypothetical protein A2Y41_11205 [Spirochaetes bacterium GWB1_36_13]